MKGIDPFSVPIKAATLDVTEDCNLRCSYCFTGDKQRRKLKLQTGKDAIDFLLRSDVSGKEPVDITFFGGEPLMEFETIKALVLYGEEQASAMGKKISFGATTNGCLLSEDIVTFWKAHNMGFLLSIDGDKESQDMYRKKADGSSSFDQLVTKIPIILKGYPNVTARITLSPETAKNLSHDILWLYSQGFNSVAVTPVQECEWSTENLELVRSEYHKVVPAFIKLWKQGRKLYLKAFDDVWKELANPPGDSHSCGAGRGYVGINVEGYLYPCHRFHDFSDNRPEKDQEWCLGSIYDGIWNEECRNKFLDFPKNRKAENPQCYECGLFGGRCNGGCYAVAWATSEKKSIYKQPDSTEHFKRIELEVALEAKQLMEQDGLWNKGNGNGNKARFTVNTPSCPVDSCASCHTVSNAKDSVGTPKPEYAPWTSEDVIRQEQEFLGLSPVKSKTEPTESNIHGDINAELDVLKVAHEILSREIDTRELFLKILDELATIKASLSGGCKKAC